MTDDYPTVQYEHKDLLSAEREIELGEIVQRGLRAKEELESGHVPEDRVAELEEAVRQYGIAREEFASHNYGLVHSEAHRFFGNGTSVVKDDIIQYGMIGLLNAIDKFDPTRGNKFSSCAVHWIKQSISRELNNVVRPIRLPESRSKVLLKIKRLEARNPELSPSEIDAIVMKEEGVTKETIMQVRSASMATYSTSSPSILESDTSPEMGDSLVAEKEGQKWSPEIEIMWDEINSKLLDIIRTNLSDMEIDILSSISKFPINEPTAPDMKVVKERYGLSSFKYKNAVRATLQKINAVMEEGGYTSNDFRIEKV